MNSAPTDKSAQAPAEKPPKPKSARRRSREIALQGLYEWLVSGTDAGVIDAHMREQEGFEKADRAHFDALLHGCIAEAVQLDAVLARFVDRKTTELSPVEHGVLMIGAYELKHCVDIPYKVAINEAVELAKSFGGTDRPQVRQWRAGQGRSRPAAGRGAGLAQGPRLSSMGRAAAMARRAAFAMALLAVGDASRAGPSGAEMRFLFGYRVQLACIQQDVSYARSPVGRNLESTPDFAGWDKISQHPFVRCLGERRFLDKALCDDITKVDVEGSRRAVVRAINESLDRHQSVLAQADSVLYLEDAARESPESFACPATLPVHVEK